MSFVLTGMHAAENIVHISAGARLRALLVRAAETKGRKREQALKVNPSRQRCSACGHREGLHENEKCLGEIPGEHCDCIRFESEHKKPTVYESMLEWVKSEHFRKYVREKYGRSRYMRQQTIIYALCNESGIIKYVGGTGSLAARFKSHISSARCSIKPCKKDEWIISLLKQGKLPDAVVLERCSTSIWREREKYWIRYYAKTALNEVGL